MPTITTGKYLKREELTADGSTHTVISVEEQELPMGDGNTEHKWVLLLKGLKPLILNATNIRRAGPPPPRRFTHTGQRRGGPGSTWPVSRSINPQTRNWFMDSPRTSVATSAHTRGGATQCVPSGPLLNNRITPRSTTWPEPRIASGRSMGSRSSRILKPVLLRAGTASNSRCTTSCMTLCRPGSAAASRYISLLMVAWPKPWNTTALATTSTLSN
jgi:hypothetical protein